MKSASFEKQGHLPVGLAIGFELGWKTTQLQDAAKIHCVAWNDDRVSSMDVLSFVQPDETALQLIARTRTDPLPTGVFFLGTVRPGQILEVAGPSGVGKTTLLLQVAVPTFAHAIQYNSMLCRNSRVTFSWPRRLWLRRFYRVITRGSQ